MSPVYFIPDASNIRSGVLLHSKSSLKGFITSLHKRDPTDPGYQEFSRTIQQLLKHMVRHPAQLGLLLLDDRHASMLSIHDVSKHMKVGSTSSPVRRTSLFGLLGNRTSSPQRTSTVRFDDNSLPVITMTVSTDTIVPLIDSRQLVSLQSKIMEYNRSLYWYHQGELQDFMRLIKQYADGQAQLRVIVD